MNPAFRPRASAAAVACLALASACSSAPSESPFVPGSTRLPETPPSASEATAVDVSMWSVPNYRLMPGDGLDFLYNLEYRLTGEDYALDILDRIHITILSHDEVNGDYQVRPDGKIMLPYLGSVMVSGLTVDKFVEKIRTSYADRFENPEIFVNLLAFGARVEELKKMVSSDRRGQIFEATVRPDGFITLPVVGDVVAAGRTAAELNASVKAAYEPHYRGIDVSTIVRATPSNVFYVLGEVKTAGQFEFSHPSTLTQALARAGVDMDVAGLETVIVINTSAAKPVGRVYNVAALFAGKNGEDTLLARDDVVFVPKSPIANADLWVNQYIERLLLYKGASFSYSVGRRIQ
jgi:protein involved in polysaccharide export with SLBB domain